MGVGVGVGDGDVGDSVDVGDVGNGVIVVVMNCRVAAKPQMQRGRPIWEGWNGGR